MCMRYEKFMEVLFEEVRQAVKTLCFPVPEVAYETVAKNNHVLIDKISFTIPGSDLRKSYDVEALYDEYREGMSIEEIAEDLCAEAMTPVPEALAHINEKMDDYNWVKDNLLVQLVNTEANEALLATGPYRSLCDLSVIYRIILSDEEYGLVSTHVQNHMMKHWNINEKRLYRDALACTMDRYPLFFRDLAALYKDIKPVQGIGAGGVICDEEPELIILSNSRLFCGAAVLLYPHVLDMIAMSLGGKIYILPSSIHEVLVVSANRVDGPEYLKQMVREVNASAVPEEDFLSNNVYSYSEEDQRLRPV